MLLALDVGNTNITIGVFEEEKLKGTFRLSTQISRTSDEFGILILNVLSRNGIDGKNIHAAIISSVVPKIMHSLTNGIRKYFNTEPLIVKAGIKTGVKIRKANPAAVGADRIVDVAAAYELYGGPILVLDFGTATTFDLVYEDGVFEAGATAPGIRISAKALWEGAAKLPEIEIEKPDTILAKDTITSMQAGVFYGYLGLTEYIIDKFKEESGLKNLRVVATGGLGRVISDNTDKIDIYNPELTLQGMRIIYNRNKQV